MPSLEQDDPVTRWGAAARDAAQALGEGHAATLSRLRDIERLGLEWPASASMLILRNFTVEPLDKYVRLGAFRRGVDLRVDIAGYDTAEFDMRDPSSTLRST